MITYCTNVHPGDGWDEAFRELRRHVPEVKARFSPGDPFPIGLRLSNSATETLAAPSTRARFADWLASTGCFVPTLNAFPFGMFGSGRVKETVYLPDWSSTARLEYTKRAARLLAEWLPPGLPGSVSTVPLGFGDEAAPSATEHVREAAVFLAEVKSRTGKDIVLCLEPEPGCVLETADGAADYIGGLDLPTAARRHIGVCIDLCHEAVRFRDPLGSCRRLESDGIRIGKIHVSAALTAGARDREFLMRVSRSRYLHQTVVRRQSGELVPYGDLADALCRHVDATGDEWRIHYHAPVFMERFGPLGTTSAITGNTVSGLRPGILLEVETYTWNQIPGIVDCPPMDASIAAELSWVRDLRNASHGRD